MLLMLLFELNWGILHDPWDSALCQDKNNKTASEALLEFLLRFLGNLWKIKY